MSTKTDVYQIVTDRIIAKLKEGVVPWRKTWKQDPDGRVVWHPAINLAAPRNLVSNRRYSGINAVLTGMAGYSSPYWMTFKQAREMGGAVRKGEKGTPIVYWRKLSVKDKERPKKPDGSDRKRDVLLIRYFTVFNLEQTEGVRVPNRPEPIKPSLPEPEPKEPCEGFEEIPACESILANSPMVLLRIQHGGDRAFYSPGLDYVQMPKPEQFVSPEAYYATLFHELAHATGNSERLNRDTLTKVASFGDHSYSQEELVAELGAAFLCSEAGIDAAVLDNSASYIQSWLRRLEDDPKFIVQAAARAQKAADYILKREREAEREESEDSAEDKAS
jgi:antirestriction protein ArdC